MIDPDHYSERQRRLSELIYKDRRDGLSAEETRELDRLKQWERTQFSLLSDDSKRREQSA